MLRMLVAAGFLRGRYSLLPFMGHHTLYQVKVMSQHPSVLFSDIARLNVIVVVRHVPGAIRQRVARAAAHMVIAMQGL
jgi:hypothetical protein